MDGIGLQSYGSMLQSRPQQCCLMDLSPRGLCPLFHLSIPPFPHPNDSSTTSEPPAPPPWFTPTPRAKLSLRSLGELHHSPSIFGYHQTSIWAETGAWLHWRAQLSSFYETTRVSSHTHTHTPLALMTLSQEFSILKCLSVYKWWRRDDLVEGSVIPQAGRYKCWLDEGWVEYLIIRDPLVFFYTTVISCGRGGREHDGNDSSSRSAPTGKLTNSDVKRALIIWSKIKRSQLDDNECKQLAINVGQWSVLAHFWLWESSESLKGFNHIPKTETYFLTHL